MDSRFYHILVIFNYLVAYVKVTKSERSALHGAYSVH